MDQDQDRQQSDDARYAALAEEIDPTPEKEEPEPKPEPKPEPEPVKHTVPLATFLESQNDAKRLRQELQEQGAKWAKVEERLNVINERMTAEPEPNEETDPLGWQKRQIAKQAKTTEDIRQSLEQFQQGFRQLTTQQQVAAAVAEQERGYAGEHPDYWQAAEHLRSVRMAQHKIMGMDNAAAAKTFSDECRWLVQNAIRANKNPAEVTYQLAKSMGYTAAQSDGAGDPVTTERPKTAAEKKLETVARGLEQRGVSAPSGAAKGGRLTPESVLAMDDDEFDKATKGKNWAKLWS